MKSKLTLGLMLAVILLISLIFVNAVSDEDIKNVLKKSLLEYFENPNKTTLTLPETKDIMHFYLTTPKGQPNVDLSPTGISSRQSIQSIFSKALSNFEGRAQESAQLPPIASEINSLNKGLRHLDSVPSGVEAPAQSSPSVSSSAASGAEAATSGATPQSSAAVSPNPMEEFNSLLNSMGQGISNVGSIPTQVK